jgi:hypothetical protein
VQPERPLLHPLADRPRPGLVVAPTDGIKIPAPPDKPLPTPLVDLVLRKRRIQGTICYTADDYRGLRPLASARPCRTLWMRSPSTAPGAMALTRIPAPPSSMARVSVRPISPRLVVA